MGVNNYWQQLVPDDGFRASRFDMDFDFALAVAVFTHLYANHIASFLRGIGAALCPGGRFYATLFEAPTDRHLESIVRLPG